MSTVPDTAPTPMDPEHIIAEMRDTIAEMQRRADFMEAQAERRYQEGKKREIAEILSRKFNIVELLSQKLSFPDLEALGRTLAALDLNVIQDAIAVAFERKKAEHAELERRKASRLANPAYQAHLAATEAALREWRERRQAGVLPPSLQARQEELAAGAL